MSFDPEIEREAYWQEMDFLAGLIFDELVSKLNEYVEEKTRNSKNYKDSEVLYELVWEKFQNKGGK